ncbi:MAG: carboxypeptidase regulatory-like domain-containing protein [Anaerolineae bacterium]|nr:carboxypeptidase regulatory-like domain-containing protein [Anaerolineae bacterium]
MTTKRSKKFWLTGLLIAGISLATLWVLTSQNSAVWSIRNYGQYQVASWWWRNVAPPQTGEPGTLRGTVSDTEGQPIAGAWVLVSRYNGETYHTQSGADGRYRIDGIPADTYRPVAGAPGYESVQFGVSGRRVAIAPRAETVADVVLPVEARRVIAPGSDFSLGDPKNLSCRRPVQSEATRRTVHFESGGVANQLTMFYTPVDVAEDERLPTLLAIYPGPADSWECVSLPLSQAGYAVLAAGPEYTFDLEADLDELERLLGFVREGRLPHADGEQIALLGGSYSSLHVQRLLQRGQAVDAALLMGPPTDLFEMRRQLEAGTFIPPFGLDQAFYALGFPSREPLRYWQYSGAFHVRPDFPPVAILHSKTDAVVPYQQSELLVQQLEAAGVPYESHILEGGGHYLLAEDGDDDALKMYDITLDFLAKHLE